MYFTDWHGSDNTTIVSFLVINKFLSTFILFNAFGITSRTAFTPNVLVTILCRKWSRDKTITHQGSTFLFDYIYSFHLISHGFSSKITLKPFTYCIKPTPNGWMSSSISDLCHSALTFYCHFQSAISNQIIKSRHKQREK